MSNSIKVKFLPKREYIETTLQYPFVLKKDEQMYLFVSQHYQVFISNYTNSIDSRTGSNAESLLSQNFEVSDIETFDNMFLAIQNDIRNIEDSIFEIVLKERNPSEWALYVKDKNEQQAIDNHENN